VGRTKSKSKWNFFGKFSFLIFVGKFERKSQKKKRELGYFSLYFSSGNLEGSRTEFYVHESENKVVFSTKLVSIFTREKRKQRSVFEY